MPAESSRKTEAVPPLSPGGCPRCGTRLGEPYKYCPNCAYRLRPDLVPHPQLPVARTPLSHRLVALGGYLLFASMLLLVVFAGFRLFAQPEPPDLVQPQVLRARDGGCLSLDLDEFVEVPAGWAFWGPYDPGREYSTEGRAEAAAEEKELAERAAAALATLKIEAAKPEEIGKALKALREAIAEASARDAIKRWADAFNTAAPHEPVEGMPDAYCVEDAFRMSRREVTNDQYFEFLRAWARKTKKPLPRHLIPAGWKRPTGSPEVPKIYRAHEGDLPVVGIPYDAALEFCGWFWEQQLGADPDLVVDLPTWKEYVLAARGDNLTYNYPWGRGLRQGEKANIGTGGLWSVVAKRDPEDFYNGFLDLVGNAAEWVYWFDNKSIVAAGWSYEDAWVYKVSKGDVGQASRVSTPFSSDGFRVVRDKEEELRSVGFRPVIRRAPALPSLVQVTAGPVRHMPCPEGILPPERLEEESHEAEEGGGETLDRIRAQREPAVSFAADTEVVDRDFEISATEVTNRQYLAFLGALAPGYDKGDLRALVPKGWRRDNLFVRYDREDEPRATIPRAYDGYYVPWEKLETLYVAGQENVPVQGITIEQAGAYVAWLSRKLGHRCAIPTAAQFLRAARGDGTCPYPWGDDRSDLELIPSYRQEPTSRAFSLRSSANRPIVGLSGNVAELVREGGPDGRLLIAGGFYDLPPRLVTLDCFLDASWDTVQFVLEPGDWDYPIEETDEKTKLSASCLIEHYTGFRVVRLADPF